MKTYPSYDALAIDLDLFHFDKVSVLLHAGNQIGNGSWVVVTDDGCCHLFDKHGNLDDIRKLHILKENYVRKDVKKIIIPDSVEEIHAYTFTFCNALMSVTIPDSITYISDYTFYYCSSLPSITIPDSVTYIGKCAFNNCINLTNITIPDSVKIIKDWAFYNCTSLTNMKIGNSVTTIGENVFSNCSSLTNVTIPDSVKSIGYNAFYNCKNLKNLFFKEKTLKQLQAKSGYYPWGIEDVDIIKTS